LTTATITGPLKDAAGNVLPNRAVTIRAVGAPNAGVGFPGGWVTEAAQTFQTDKNGLFGPSGAGVALQLNTESTDGYTYYEIDAVQGARTAKRTIRLSAAGTFLVTDPSIQVSTSAASYVGASQAALDAETARAIAAEAGKASTNHHATHLTGGPDAIPLATGSADGLMPSTDHNQIASNTAAIAAETTRATAAEGLLVPKTRVVSAGTGLAGGGDLTADRTLSIAAGGVGRSQIDPTWRGGPLVFDDRFTSYPDGALAGQAVPGTGQVWTTQGFDSTGALNPLNDAKIVGGAFVQTGVNGAAYATIDTGPTAHDWESVEFLFGAGSTFGAAVGLVCSSQGANNFGAVRSVHCVIGPTTWSLGIWPNGTLVILASGTFTTSLTVGKTYQAVLHRVGNTVVLDLPTADSVLGRTVTVTDRRIGGRSNAAANGLWGRYAIFESYTKSATYLTDQQPTILRASAGRSGINAGMSPTLEIGPPTVGGVAEVGLPGVAITGLATLATVANLVYYWEFEARAPWTLKSFPCEVTVAASAGSKAWFAVVPIDSTCQPTSDPAVQSTEFAIDAVAVLAPGPIGGALLMPAGRFALAFACSGSATMRAFLGLPAIPSIAKTLGAAPFALYRYVALTYASTVPATMPAWTTTGRAAAGGYHLGLLEWS
jgi:hypothetical protein